ncbi:hypothetical protein AUG19_02730 [archaeon 13_1_20CM_2_54_9]|nr:MAG: hypothetical protein AUG19_02730 [archaeon 13_1_20CM_2_54_9]
MGIEIFLTSRKYWKGFHLSARPRLNGYRIDNGIIRNCNCVGWGRFLKEDVGGEDTITTLSVMGVFTGEV